jgi:hypothetical protein
LSFVGAASRNFDAALALVGAASRNFDAALSFVGAPLEQRPFHGTA